MKIKSIGINVRHGRELEEVRPNGMGFYLLSVIKSKAEYIIDGVFYEVTPPSYVIMRPTTSVVFRATKEEEILVSWISFDMSKEEEAELASCGVLYDVPVPVSSVTEAEEMFAIANYEHYLNDSVHIVLESHVLAVTILMLARQMKNRESNLGINRNRLELLNRLRVDIYNNPKEERSVDSMAEQIGVSRSGFQHMYKKVFGIPVSADVINARVSLAKLLLVNTKCTQREIAERCGYATVFYFMRQFKEATGMTPGDYRKNGSGE
ncbi:MAG: AraC family transcriptional regulator [Lachnospiraceae bacterium]|nr:AraC family transcriptional regulator [Lachnospiraceae bacterium]